MNRSVYDDDKCAAIWDAVVQQNDYDWPIRTSVRDKLVALLGEEFILDNNLLSSDIDSSIRLREKLSQNLKSSDQRFAAEVASWIVTDWGGIRSGKEAIPGWIKALSTYDWLSVRRFVATMGTSRISSWSKILAFADHTKYAIFDSRTSLALNASMVRNGIPPRFFMPLAQGNKRDAARNLIKSKGSLLVGGFEEYHHLLGRFVEIGKAQSILEAERTIFASAYATADEMLKEHNL